MSLSLCQSCVTSLLLCLPVGTGTWVYGRDGWCDGREVDPWVWDVTDELLPPGKGNNTIQYFGWFEGHTPDPTTAGAYIIMYSHLAFYTKP